MLAIIWATRYFRPYFFGRKFTLYTDHQPLTYALNLKTPNSKLVKWRLQLSEYDFEIRHRPGRQNVVADALSRIPEINVNEESSDADSVHSADTDVSEFVECTERPINFFHNQIILKIGTDESETYEEIFPKVHRRIITKVHFSFAVIFRIFQEYMDPSKQNCILCLVPTIQVVYRNHFSSHKTFRVKISQKLLIDVTAEEEQDLLIEQTHECSHRGSRKTTLKS